MHAGACVPFDDCNAVIAFIKAGDPCFITPYISIECLFKASAEADRHYWIPVCHYCIPQMSLQWRGKGSM